MSENFFNTQEKVIDIEQSLKEPSKSEQKENIEDQLPIERYEAEIKELIKNNETSIVVGETGSGKTTMIPKFISEVIGSDKRIAITQPRRMAATSVARYVAKLMNTKLGDKVGYQIRFDKKSKRETSVNFMTDGILLRALQDDPLLKSYDFIMVDEAHERNLNIDFTLGLLKNAQRLRQEAGLDELKVLVSSATLEKEKFANYFDQAPMVEVPGRLYPVDINYEKTEPDNYMKAAARKVNQVIKQSKEVVDKDTELSKQELLKNEGDILIFMPGQREIEETIKMINRMLVREEWQDNIDVLPLYGRLSPKEQDKIFSKSSKRKIIVSTNIAETSLTVPGITTVIDSGLIKQIDYDESTGIESLHAVPHAQSGCEQRMGRAGRLAPGQCYRLFPKYSFNERRDFQKPEILRSSLAGVVLTMKKMGLQNIKDFDFIDKPDSEKFDNAINTLKHLGALAENEMLTETGELMSEIPLEPRYARMLVEAVKLGEVKDLTTITAFLSAGKSVFVRPRQEAGEADMAHDKFKVEGSDYLTMLNVWKKYKNARKFIEIDVKVDYDTKIEDQVSGIKDEKEKQKEKRRLNRQFAKSKNRKIEKKLGKWAYDNYLNNKVLHAVNDIRYQLSSILAQNKKRLSGKGNEENIQKCITAGLLENLANFSGYHRYSKYYDSGIDNLYIHPGSTVFGEEPAYLVSGDIVETSKPFMRNVQEVKLEWLLDVAPHLIREKQGEYIYEDNDGKLYKIKSYFLKKWEQEVKEEKQYINNEDLVLYFVKNKNIIPEDIHQQNKEILDYAYDLLYRVAPNEDIDFDIWDLYKEKVGKVQAKDLSDAKKIAENIDWKISLTYFIDEAQEQMILDKYPNEMEVGGELTKVYYSQDKSDGYKAFVDLGAENILTLEADIRSGLELPSGDKLAVRVGNIISLEAQEILEAANKKFKKEQLDNVNYEELEKEIPFVLGEELPDLPEKVVYGVDYLAEKDLYLYPYYELDQENDVLKLKFTSDPKQISSAEFNLNQKIKDYKEAKRLAEKDQKERIKAERYWQNYYNRAMDKIEPLSEVVNDLKKNESLLDKIFAEAGDYLDDFNKACEIVDNPNEYLVDDDIKARYKEMKDLIQSLKKLKKKAKKKEEFSNLSMLDKLKATFNSKK